MEPIEPPPTSWRLPDPELVGRRRDRGRRRRPRTRARCWPPTGWACSRCRSAAAAWRGSPPTRAPSSPSTGCASAARCGAARRASRSASDTCFADVMVRCADPRRPGGWITPKFVKAYLRLHHMGWAHSVECYADGELVGGLYGVRIGGFFAGESMFHTATDASKVALVALVELAPRDRRRAAGRAVDDAAPALAGRRRAAPTRVPRPARGGGQGWVGGPRGEHTSVMSGAGCSATRRG